MKKMELMKEKLRVKGRFQPSALKKPLPSGKKLTADDLKKISGGGLTKNHNQTHV